MLVPILIVTPAPGFGEMIRSTLIEVDEFRPVLASGRADALAHARREPFALAILDGDLLETPLAELGAALLGVLPRLRFVLIPPENGLPEGLTKVFAIHGCLSKPFYLPDLPGVVRQALERDGEVPLPAPSAEPADQSAFGRIGSDRILASPSAPAWLDDVNRAAQHLIRLSLEADAEAALITRRGQLWAYAGQLPQPAAQELAALVALAAPGAVSPGTGGGASSDLARFIRLESTGGEYMLYATGLNEEMVLAMAFDAEMPFSKIRKQAGSLARALASPPELDEKLPALDTLLAAQRGAAVHPSPDEDWPEEADVDPTVPLFPLDHVPPPTPAGEAPPVSAGLPGERPANGLAGWGQTPVSDSRRPPVYRRASAVSPSLEAGPAAPAGPSASAAPAPASPPALAAPPALPYTLNEPLADREMAQAQSFDAPLPARRELPPLEPVSPALYSLKYACVLVPRLPNHYLTGDLTGRLTGWVRQLSVAFAWRLEHLSIRPDYILWISDVPPDTSPGYLVKMMRRHTSQRIFYDFPALAQENPSGDFWAPHYLVIAASQPPPPQVLREFVENARSSFHYPLADPRHS